MKLSLGLLLGSLVVFAGCASQQKKFDRVVPGMSAEDVQKTMGSGPSRFEQSADDARYTTMSWNDDFCVLLHDGKTVLKDSAKTGRSVSGPMGSYEEKSKASCPAPGQTKAASTTRTIDVPGIGKVQLPESEKLREPANEPPLPPAGPH